MTPDVEAVIATAATVDVPAACQSKARDLWTSTIGALEALRNVEFQRTHPASLETASQLEALDGDILTPLADLARMLVAVIVLDPRPVQLDENVVPRILIEFIPTAQLVDLRGLIESALQSATAGTAVGTGWELPLSEFLAQWLRDLIKQGLFGTATSRRTMNLYNLNSNPDSPLDGLLVRKVPESSSATSAFDAWGAQLRQIEDRFLRARTLAPELQQIAEARRVAQESAADAQRASTAAGRASGEVGADAIARHFVALGGGERRRAQLWTGVTAVAAIATIVLAYLTIHGLAGDAQTWSKQLVHLAVTLPVIALGVYSSKTSSRHRAQAWWADSRAAQLHAFPAFVAPLPDEARARLEEEFGRYVFAAVGDIPGADVSTSVAPMLDEVVHAVREVAAKIK